MKTQKTDPVQSAAARRVPDELIQRLHAANQRLEEARAALGEAMDQSLYRHEERVEQANGDLRSAEGAVEAISDEIHKALQAMPKTES
jgi:hypothetical protein